MSQPERVPSICRNCLAYCPILVTVKDGRPLAVTGDPEAPAFDGYTCPKGRALPEQHNSADRLLHVRKRTSDGGWARIDHATLVEDVAAQVQRLLAEHGPRSIAMYTGTGPVSAPLSGALGRAWMRAIGSGMLFSAASIDKPAEYTSVALHGNWVAGLQSFETADTWMLVGANPVIAKSNGAPMNNPGQRLKEAQKRGLKLIVIDPRRTETARRAHVHLQIVPGEDPAVLAGLIHVILREQLHDAAFVAENAQGLDELRAAVAPFDPEAVAARAGITAADLVEAARTFARGRRGGVVCSTGASFATRSNLTFYLALCLNTLTGRWVRAGEPAPFPNVLLPAFVPKAQPYAPYPVLSDRPMRVHGLSENASGVPTAALADEILLDGPGQIKALFCVGGNPVLSWPDQRKAEAALRKLELLVVFDYRMTASARFAHYVVPPPLSLELPGTSQKVESLKYSGVSRGYSMPWAQYTPAVARAPAGSEFMGDWEFFFRLAQRMGLKLVFTDARGAGPHQEGEVRRTPLDMSRVPSIEELTELACAGSRVPLSEVKRHPHGHLFEQLNVRVQPRDPDCHSRLELAAPMMMAELAQIAASSAAAADPDLPFKLVCRRSNRFMNSMGQAQPGLAPPSHTPAAMHPLDLQDLGLHEGELIGVRSRADRITARVAADATLRRGLVSVVHGFGDALDAGAPAHAVTRLVDMSERDPISGIPRMTGIPVAVEPA